MQQPHKAHHATALLAQALEADLRNKYDETISYSDVMSAAMYPKVFEEYR